jgi:quercetin dioxygenase-like cupin family protein
LYSMEIAVAQQHTAVSLRRLYTGADNESHVEQVEVKFSPAGGASATVEESDHINAASTYLVRVAPGFYESWHNADKRRYVVTLSGSAEIEAGGRKFIAKPGGIALAEDLTGKGHTFRVVGREDWVALFVDFAQ